MEKTLKPVGDSLHTLDSRGCPAGFLAGKRGILLEFILSTSAAWFGDLTALMSKPENMGRDPKAFTTTLVFL